MPGGFTVTAAEPFMSPQPAGVEDRVTVKEGCNSVTVALASSEQEEPAMVTVTV